MTDSRTMSSDDYARQAEATRHRLANDLRELSDHLTPGQIVDEMLTYARGGGATFLSSMSGAARANPIPSFLIGAGLLILMSEKTGLTHVMGGRAERRVRDAGQTARRRTGAIGNGAADAVGSARNAASDLAEATRDRAADLAGAARNAATGLGANITDGAEAIGEQMHDAANFAGERMHDAAEAAGERLRHAADAAGEGLAATAREAPARVGETIGNTRDGLLAFVRDQPLMAGAIGIAVGAAIATALPRTREEDAAMGEASDAVKETVGEFATEEAAKVRTAAEHVARDVAESARREGLTSDGVAAAAREAGERVSEATGAPAKPDAN